MGMQDSKAGLRLSGQFLKAAATGMVVGFICAFLLGSSVWLEMRVNVGHAIPAFMAISVFYAVLKRRTVKLAYFLLLEALALFIALTVYGFSFPVLLIVPAALFRDGFHLASVSLQGIDLFLLCSLGAVNVGWICAAVMMQRRTEDHQKKGSLTKWMYV